MRNRAIWIAASVLALTFVPAFVASAAVNDTTPISATPAGVLADGPSGPGVAINADARYVVFESEADNLSDADNDSVKNVYVHDRETGTTELVSRASGPGGAGADANSSNPAISPGGRVVAFESRATNLSDSDGDTVSDVFLRDLTTDTTTLASRAPDGSPADGDSGDPALSGTRIVVFESVATNLSDADDDAVSDIFTYGWAAGTTTLVSRIPRGPGGDGPSFDPSVSKDGRRFAFASQADNLERSGRRPFHQRVLRGAAVLSDEGRESHDHVGVRVRTRRRRLVRPGHLRRREPHRLRVDCGQSDRRKSRHAVDRRCLREGDLGQQDRACQSRDRSKRCTRVREFRLAFDLGRRAPWPFASGAGNLSSDDGGGIDVFVRDAADTTTLMSRASGAAGTTGPGD